MLLLLSTKRKVVVGFISQKNMFSTILLSTHEVTNQSKPLQDYNVYDSILDNAMKQLHPSEYAYKVAKSKLHSIGMTCGSLDMQQHSDAAQRNKPILKQYDNYGRRVDIVEYHQSYHTLMNTSLSCGGAAYGYLNSSVGSSITTSTSSPTPIIIDEEDNDSGAHIITRAGIIYMLNQLEPSHCCPVVMTSAAIPVLQKLDYMSDTWTKKLMHLGYDSRNVPISEKESVTIGMSMTEKQGGSDVRANTTTATPISASGEGMGYNLIGHKWFTSAPMSDGFLTLAKTTNATTKETGLSCFLVPRWRPDGSRNSGFQIIRLKDKLGDHANASSEVEYREAYGTLIGQPNKGVKTIIEMVQSTRLDCVLGSAGGMRKGLHLALNHASYRSAFGKVLISQPLMMNLLT